MDERFPLRWGAVPLSPEIGQTRGDRTASSTRPSARRRDASVGQEQGPIIRRESLEANREASLRLAPHGAFLVDPTDLDRDAVVDARFDLVPKHAPCLLS